MGDGLHDKVKYFNAIVQKYFIFTSCRPPSIHVNLTTKRGSYEWERLVLQQPMRNLRF
jgi:hypothetical protein